MAALKREGTGNDAFDQREYDELRIHYFEPVVQHNVRLPGGRVLRKQTSPPRIDQKGRGYDALRKQIAELEKKKDKIGVWHLLRQLRAWEMRPPSLGGAVLAGSSDADVTETIDLTKEINAVDVDSYIIDVLLTKVVQVKRDPDGGEVEVSRPAPQPFKKRVKLEPGIEPESEPADSRLKVGAAVRKKFIGSGWFDGSVTSIADGRFEVLWSDDEQKSYPFNAATKMLDAASEETLEGGGDLARAPENVPTAKEAGVKPATATVSPVGEEIKAALRQSLKRKGMDSAWLDKVALSHYECNTLPRRDDSVSYSKDEFVIQSINQVIAAATWEHTNGDKLRIVTKLTFDKTFKASKSKGVSCPSCNDTFMPQLYNTNACPSCGADAPPPGESETKWYVSWDETYEHGDGYSLQAALPTLEIDYIPANETKKTPRVHVQALDVDLIDGDVVSAEFIWKLWCFDSNRTYQLWSKDHPQATFRMWETWEREVGVENGTRLAMKSLGVGGKDVHEFAGMCLVLGGMKTSLWKNIEYDNGEEGAVKKALAHVKALRTLKLVEKQAVQEPQENPEIELTEEILAQIPEHHDETHGFFSGDY